MRKAPSDGSKRSWAKLSAGPAAFRNHVKALEALATAVASGDMDGQTQAMMKVRRSA